MTMTELLGSMPNPPSPPTPDLGVPPVPIGFAPSIRLTKVEAFGACQALADAGRLLLRAGLATEADALGDLFELLEQRLVAGAESD
ncbi:MAG: hypothetical protein ACYCV7_01115 [Acidimicrobiales bacterium]